MSRVINEFELCQELARDVSQHEDQGTREDDFRHHEQMRGVQKTFQSQVMAVCSTIEELGNPFTDQTVDLFVLDTRDVMDTKVIETVRAVGQLGKEQYQQFVAKRLQERTTPLFDTIQKNKLPLFNRRPATKEKSNDKLKITTLKSNCSLFSRLYVSCQVRDGDLDGFFAHENQNFPPSLSQYGKLRTGTKSDLLTCLEKMTPAQGEIPTVEVLLLDGAAIVNMLKPGASKTFQEYCGLVFLPYVTNQLRHVDRVDVVWDRYFPGSLKDSARSKRGKGVRRQVRPNTRIPGNWAAFLRVDENKEELFHYLAEQLTTIRSEHGKVVSTKGETVVFNNERDDIADLAPCKHEEADTRLLLHAADAAKRSYTKVMIRTVDTDVVVISIAKFHHISLSELWIDFGVGKHRRYLPAHDISRSIGQEKSKALLAFHAFTGCDQTSSFAHHGKKTAWDAWQTFNEVTEAFQVLSNAPTVDDLDEVMPIQERMAYSRAIRHRHV